MKDTVIRFFLTWGCFFLGERLFAAIPDGMSVGASISRDIEDTLNYQYYHHERIIFYCVISALILLSDRVTSKKFTLPGLAIFAVFTGAYYYARLSEEYFDYYMKPVDSLGEFLARFLPRPIVDTAGLVFYVSELLFPFILLIASKLLVAGFRRRIAR